MRTPYILPYNTGSKSAKALAEALGCKRIKLRNSRFRGSQRKFVINWGNCDVPHPVGLNQMRAVNNASDKVFAFGILLTAGVPIPQFTVSWDTAGMWKESGHTVVCRKLTRANSGRGIVVSGPGEGLTPAPLYTKYIKKKDEYRVHVFNGRVIDTQRKMRNRSVPDSEVNWMVRSYSSGFIFGREAVEQSLERDDIAIQAVQALRLDFGAVDIIFNAHQQRYYVLEVNTAPGLQGTTLTKYVEAIRGIL